YVGTDSIMKFIADQTVPLYPPGTRFWMLTQDLYKSIDMKPLMRDKESVLRNDELEKFENAAKATDPRDEKGLQMLATSRADFSKYLAEYAHKNLQLIYELTAEAHPRVKSNDLTQLIDDLIFNW